jgi:hypothetical protein
MDLEWGPLSLVSTIVKLLKMKSRGSGLEIWNTVVGIRCSDYATALCPQKLALTSLISGGRSVGLVPLRTKATELLLKNGNGYTLMNGLHVTLVHFLFRLRADT